MKKKLISGGIIAGLIAGLIVCLPMIKDSQAQAYGYNSASNRIVYSQNQKPEKTASDYQSTLGTEANPYIIMELVPYEDMSTIGYLVTNQGNVKESTLANQLVSSSNDAASIYKRLFGSNTNTTREKVEKGLTFGGSDTVAKSENKSQYRFVSDAGDVTGNDTVKNDSLSPTFAEYGYFQRVADGTGTYKLVSTPISSIYNIPDSDEDTSDSSDNTPDTPISGAASGASGAASGASGAASGASGAASGASGAASGASGAASGSSGVASGAANTSGSTTSGSSTTQEERYTYKFVRATVDNSGVKEAGADYNWVPLGYYSRVSDDITTDRFVFDRSDSKGLSTDADGSYYILSTTEADGTTTDTKTYIDFNTNQKYYVPHPGVREYTYTSTAEDGTETSISTYKDRNGVELTYNADATSPDAFYSVAGNELYGAEHIIYIDSQGWSYYNYPSDDAANKLKFRIKDQAFSNPYLVISSGSAETNDYAEHEYPLTMTDDAARPYEISFTDTDAAGELQATSSSAFISFDGQILGTDTDGTEIPLELTADGKVFKGSEDSRVQIGVNDFAYTETYSRATIPFVEYTDDNIEIGYQDNPFKNYNAEQSYSSHFSKYEFSWYPGCEDVVRLGTYSSTEDLTGLASKAADAADARYFTVRFDENYVETFQYVITNNDSLSRKILGKGAYDAENNPNGAHINVIPVTPAILNTAENTESFINDADMIIIHDMQDARLQKDSNDYKDDLVPDGVTLTGSYTDEDGSTVQVDIHGAQDGKEADGGYHYYLWKLGSNGTISYSNGKESESTHKFYGDDAAGLLESAVKNADGSLVSFGTDAESDNADATYLTHSTKSSPSVPNGASTASASISNVTDVDSFTSTTTAADRSNYYFTHDNDISHNVLSMLVKRQASGNPAAMVLDSSAIYKDSMTTLNKTQTSTTTTTTTTETTDKSNYHDGVPSPISVSFGPGQGLSSVECQDSSHTTPGQRGYLHPADHQGDYNPETGTYSNAHADGVWERYQVYPLYFTNNTNKELRVDSITFYLPKDIFIDPSNGQKGFWDTFQGDVKQEIVGNYNKVTVGTNKSGVTISHFSANETKNAGKIELSCISRNQEELKNFDLNSAPMVVTVEDTQGNKFTTGSGQDVAEYLNELYVIMNYYGAKYYYNVYCAQRDENGVATSYQVPDYMDLSIIGCIVDPDTGLPLDSNDDYEHSYPVANAETSNVTQTIQQSQNNSYDITTTVTKSSVQLELTKLTQDINNPYNYYFTQSEDAQNVSLDEFGKYTNTHLTQGSYGNGIGKSPFVWDFDGNRSAFTTAFNMSKYTTAAVNSDGSLGDPNSATAADVDASKGNKGNLKDTITNSKGEAVNVGALINENKIGSASNIAKAASIGYSNLTEAANSDAEIREVGNIYKTNSDGTYVTDESGNNVPNDTVPDSYYKDMGITRPAYIDDTSKEDGTNLDEVFYQRFAKDAKGNVIASDGSQFTGADGQMAAIQTSITRADMLAFINKEAFGFNGTTGDKYKTSLNILEIEPTDEYVYGSYYKTVSSDAASQLVNKYTNKMGGTNITTNIEYYSNFEAVKAGKVYAANIKKNLYGYRGNTRYFYNYNNNIFNGDVDSQYNLDKEYINNKVWNSGISASDYIKANAPAWKDWKEYYYSMIPGFIGTNTDLMDDVHITTMPVWEYNAKVTDINSDYDLVVVGATQNYKNGQLKRIYSYCTNSGSDSGTFFVDTKMAGYNNNKGIVYRRYICYNDSNLESADVNSLGQIVTKTHKESWGGTSTTTGADVVGTPSAHDSLGDPSYALAWTAVGDYINAYYTSDNINENVYDTINRPQLMSWFMDGTNERWGVRIETMNDYFISTIPFSVKVNEIGLAQNRLAYKNNFTGAYSPNGSLNQYRQTYSDTNRNNGQKGSDAFMAKNRSEARDLTKKKAEALLDYADKHILVLDDAIYGDNSNNQNEAIVDSRSEMYYVAGTIKGGQKEIFKKSQITATNKNLFSVRKNSLLEQCTFTATDKTNTSKWPYEYVNQNDPNKNTQKVNGNNGLIFEFTAGGKVYNNDGTLKKYYANVYADTNNNAVYDGSLEEERKTYAFSYNDNNGNGIKDGDDDIPKTPLSLTTEKLGDVTVYDVTDPNNIRSVREIYPGRKYQVKASVASSFVGAVGYKLELSESVDATAAESSNRHSETGFTRFNPGYKTVVHVLQMNPDPNMKTASGSRSDANNNMPFFNSSAFNNEANKVQDFDLQIDYLANNKNYGFYEHGATGNGIVTSSDETPVTIWKAGGYQQCSYSTADSKTHRIVLHTRNSQNVFDSRWTGAFNNSNVRTSQNFASKAFDISTYSGFLEFLEQYDMVFLAGRDCASLTDDPRFLKALTAYAQNGGSIIMSHDMIGGIWTNRFSFNGQQRGIKSGASNDINNVNGVGHYSNEIVQYMQLTYYFRKAAGQVEKYYTPGTSKYSYNTVYANADADASVSRHSATQLPLENSFLLGKANKTSYYSYYTTYELQNNAKVANDARFADMFDFSNASQYMDKLAGNSLFYGDKTQVAAISISKINAEFGQIFYSDDYPANKPEWKDGSYTTSGKESSISDPSLYAEGDKGEYADYLSSILTNNDVYNLRSYRVFARKGNINFQSNAFEYNALFGNVNSFGINNDPNTNQSDLVYICPETRIGWPNDMTTIHISNANKGKVSTYPFNLNNAKFITTAATHVQQYRLDLDHTNSYVNGAISNLSDDTIVWYDLATDTGSNVAYYSNSPYYGYLKGDSANNYYIYTKGAVTYTGVGHGNSLTRGEIQLFINTMIASYRPPEGIPIIKIKNADKQTNGNETTIFVDEANSTKDASGALSTDAIFEITDPSLSNVTRDYYVKVYEVVKDEATGQYVRKDVDLNSYNEETNKYIVTAADCADDKSISYALHKAGTAGDKEYYTETRENRLTEKTEGSAGLSTLVAPGSSEQNWNTAGKTKGVNVKGSDYNFNTTTGKVYCIDLVYRKYREAAGADGTIDTTFYPWGEVRHYVKLQQLDYFDLY